MVKTNFKITFVSIELFSSHFVQFSYNGVYYNVLKLSVSDFIAGQKDSNGVRKGHFFGLEQ